MFVSCFTEDRRSRCAPLSLGLFLLFSLLLCGLNTPATAQSGGITVANSSFETPVISSVVEYENGYAMRQAGVNPVWTITDYAGIGLAEYFNKDASGQGQVAPDGNQVGYVQSWHGTGSALWQAVSGLQAGQSYYVIVAAAQDGGNTGGIAMPVQVSLGAQSYTFTPTGTNYRDYTFGPFMGSAASQTLRFATVTQSTSVNAIVMLDNVRVVPASSAFAEAPGVPTPNFSFEAPTISNYDEFEDGYAMMQAGTNVGWTLSAYSGIGLAEYFNKDEPDRGQLAPDGSQVAYVQSYYSYAPGTISQTVPGFQPGQSYYLIVSAAQCSGNDVALPVVASLGGQTYMFTPSGTQYQDYTFGPVTATAASQTVSFMAVPQSASVAATAMLDNVRVVLSAAPFTPAGLSLYPATVTGGSSSLGTVTLSSYAPPGGVVVTLSSDTPAVTVPASVTVPGGQRSATFPVSTTDVNAATTATISATAGGVTQTATLTVNGAPTNLVATAGDGDVSLYWTGVSSASGYNIYRSTTSGSGYVKVNTTAIADQTYEDDSVTNGVTYYYVVTAVSDTIESAYSNEDSAQPLAAFNLSAVSTGDGKITLYWDDPSGMPNNTGYNIYRGTVSGGEDYTHPVNGATPVTALSYANGGTHIFTDVGLTNGQQYFYTVVAVTSTGLSAPSNEDSDYVDPNAVPWDTRDPGQIISTVANLSSEPMDTGFDVIRVMGPDGAIYDNGDGAQEQPDATPSPNSNIWDLKDGTAIPVPEEVNSDTPDVTPAVFRAAGIMPNADPKPKAVPSNTGPLRRVVSQPGFVKASVLITLPPAGSISKVPYSYSANYTRVRIDRNTVNGSIKKVKTLVPIGNTGDTPYIYMGSFGTVVNPQGSRVVKATVDAGLFAQYDKTNQTYQWYAFNNPSGARDPFVSSIFAATDDNNKYFSSGDQVRMTYYLQNPTGVPQRNKTLVYLKVESQTTGQPAIIIPAMVDTHPANGAGVVMKRVTSIAQNLAKQNGDYQKGYRKSGSFVLNETLQNGSLYPTATGSPLSWSAARTLTTFEGFPGSLFFPSGVVNASVLTPYSFEANLGIDLR